MPVAPPAGTDPATMVRQTTIFPLNYGGKEMLAVAEKVTTTASKYINSYPEICIYKTLLFKFLLVVR